MAQFYGDIQGNRGEATRMGSKESGISGHIRGWSTGAKVTVTYDPILEKDIVHVYRTGGSNGNGMELVGMWCDTKQKDVGCSVCLSRFKCLTE
jgi:hypothetical protein